MNAMLTLTLYILAFCLPAFSIPLREILLTKSTSCQVYGGNGIANLTCRNTCIEQGDGWTGGFCDDKQICHCTFGVSG
ncbi:hypothetical protein BO70DRAFT_396705 [Aspergillus heteromorphus CBS 117.55]|uniref:Invertebrate defensins family profile domain-containing protein n=1 Tax=Aspergillus heteromorphus CBS 117.55 TaxID=1448321 RepID=A0A317WCN6_9EURO|nr:uncharacterized protein BO70DRAFT_396705 [Aspergillus heteromorphus CBS 117.55]PWY81920.1 hypothetical protein BO70DRAFT_396705 [Aspergillus heteromorphus CBS 117.55]